MKTITVYLHSSKETMYDRGKAAGLTGDALDMFSFACNEVAVELLTDEQTGYAVIMRVDGRNLHDVDVRQRKLGG